MRRFLLLYRSISMYRFMWHYLRVVFAAAVVLSLFGALPYSPLPVLFTGFLFVLLCLFINSLFARLYRVRTNRDSAYITALILSLIVGPLSLSNIEHGLLVGAVISFFAMGSKFLIAPYRHHVFNPAAFGVLAGFLLIGTGATWWVATPKLLPFVTLGGLLITAKMRRGLLLSTFLLTYLALLFVYTLVTGGGVLSAADLMWSSLLYTPLLFFALVMVVEPLTSPRRQALRVVYGLSVAAGIFLLEQFVRVPYSLELSLLFGNIVSWALHPPKRWRVSLFRAEEVASRTFGFWTSRPADLSFRAGQFLEWMLPHLASDAKGTRRYFTIASSPTEKELLLATKLAAPSSSFKEALRELHQGAELYVSDLGGDFVLPENPQEKLAFVAGGIGITPFRSMTKYLLDRNETRDIMLLYACNADEDFAYRKLFEEAKKVGVSSIFHVGSIDASLVRAKIPDWKERTFFVSGPEGLVEKIAKDLLITGVRKVKRDYFPGYV
jgi:ferredoxin-NADP reductase/Na+-translocating ferredoxin:NAD+ oxidoreductase RnfD subunit